MSGCFCADLEIEGEFYGPCAVCERETMERLAQEELDRVMEGVRLREQMELEDHGTGVGIHCCCGYWIPCKPGKCPDNPADEYGCDGERSGLSGIIW